MTRRAAIAALTCAGALIGAAETAAAAPLISIDQGEHASVATDERGTGHVAYVNQDAGWQLRYCRLAPAAGQCAGGQVFDVAGSSNNPQQVMLPDPSSAPDELLIFSQRPGGGQLFRSQDSGGTFAPPTAVGGETIGVSQTAFGPGAFQFSRVSWYGCVSVGTCIDYRATPVTGGAPGPTTVNAGAKGGADPTVGFADPTTPVVAWQTQDGFGYRVYGGAGDVNDMTNWLPVQEVAFPFVDLQLLSGPKGLFLFGRGSSDRQYYLSRFDPATKTFQPSVVAPASGVEGAAAWQDAEGILHFVDWNLPSGGGPLYSVSGDGGVTFTPPTRFIDGTAAFAPDRLEGATASNGNGFLALSTAGASADPRVYAVELPPLNSLGGGAAVNNCPTVRFGPVVALPTKGCFTRKGSEFTTTGPVRINGIDIAPPGGAAGASAAATPSLTIDTAKQLIESSGSREWSLSAGPVSLGTAKLDWKVPLDGGRPVDISTSGPVMLDASQGGQKLLGLPISGNVIPSLSKGAAKLPVNLELPEPISGLIGGAPTDNIDLSTSIASGLRLAKGEVHIHQPEVFLGIASIHPFDIDYTDDPNVFRGAIGIDLPLVGGGLDGAIEFREGEFVDAIANYTPPDPGIPIAPPYAYLTSVGLHVHKLTSCSDPTKLEILGSVSGGPKVLDVSLVRIDGSVSYSLPEASCNLPGVFNISGQGYLVEIPVANLDFTYKLPYDLSFAANFGIGTEDLGARANVEGRIDFNRGDWYAHGDMFISVLSYKPVSTEMTVSSLGFSACTTIVPAVLIAGVVYKWGDGLPSIVLDCDEKELLPAAFQASVRKAQSASTFVLPKGLTSAGVVVRGVGGAPKVTLTGPDGSQFTTGDDGIFEDAFRRFRSITLHKSAQTSISIKRPRAGRWTVSHVGGATIAGVEVARASTPVSMSAGVRSRGGRKRVLNYRVRRTAIQQVKFFEQGPDSFNLIGRARGARGSIPFSAVDGSRGRRAIVAIATQRGTPLARRVVAHYQAPGPIRPSKPRGLRVRRKGKGLVVGWKRGRNTSRYVVRVLLRDGRKLLFVKGRRARKVKVPYVPGIDSGRILVAGLTKANQRGPIAKAKLKAQRPKKKRKRNRR